MAIDKVRKYLKKFNKDEDILEFSVSSATVKDVAVIKKQSQVIGEEIII